MDLFWPGDERAGEHFAPDRFLDALVLVEDCWLGSLVEVGIAPEGVRGTQVRALVRAEDLRAIAREAEAGGNPVIPLVRLLRQRLGDSDAATWLHRGLTSQDVLDTALALRLREALDRILEEELPEQARALAGLADRHRSTAMPGRTLTQWAVPTTFGLMAATWLAGVTAAADALDRARAALAVQVGGAGGTLAAIVELARGRGLPDPVAVAGRAADDLALRLGLAGAAPWHTDRHRLTGAADALVACADAWGHLAGDVLLRARPEIGELAEPATDGRGGSSTMPQKSNPVLAVLLRRHALAAPPLAATLHTAAAAYVDQRPDGAWHAEWSALATLGRRSVVAASQATELLTGLRVDVARMRANLTAAGDGLLAEQRSIAALVDAAPGEDYLGAADALIDTAIERSAPLRGRTG